GQHPFVHRVARCFQRENKARRRLAGPFAECIWLLVAVEGAIDFDRGELAACELKLTGMGQALRIKTTPPAFLRPPANSRADHRTFIPIPYPSMIIRSRTY